MRQKGWKFKVNLGHTVRPCHKQRENEKRLLGSFRMKLVL